MKCTLMNKNKEVLVAEYNEVLKVFTDIYEIKNIEYAPLVLFNSYNKDINITPVLTDWFKGRGIPSWRDDLDLLLAKLNITSPEELLDKAFGLSLSDQYWVKQTNSNIEYKDINFFEHDFEDSEFTNATFGNGLDSSTKISLISPNNTTDGRLKKTWIIENSKRYLLDVSLPCADKKELDLFQSGTDVIIKLKNFKRNIPLPNVLRNYMITSAKLEEGILHIQFEKDDKE